jgi:copper chaperone NosL
MGAQEVVPFKELDDAETFAAQWGGQIMSLDAIPTEAVLGPIDLDQTLETPS